MNLDPLLHASPVIQIHAFAAILAFIIGALVLFRRKGDAAHRLWGKIWVAAMVIAALSSFFIWTIRLWGPFSPIHLLSLLTLVLLYRGVSYARRHQIRLHKRMMQGTYISALVIAGLFTFAPGRIMNRVVFGRGGADPAGWITFGTVVVLVALVAILISRFRPARRQPPATTP